VGPGTEVHRGNRKEAEDYGNSTTSAVEFVADHRSALERGHPVVLSQEEDPAPKIFLDKRLPDPYSSK